MTVKVLADTNKKKRNKFQLNCRRTTYIGMRQMLDSHISPKK